jgi:hypothetical protein
MIIGFIDGVMPETAEDLGTGAKVHEFPASRVNEL